MITAGIKPTRQDLEIIQGATMRLALVWEQPAGTPVNLTGWSARLQIRINRNSPVLFEMSTANGRITLGTNDGHIDLNASASETDVLDFSSAMYDLDMISPGNEVTTLLSGKIFLNPGVVH